MPILRLSRRVVARVGLCLPLLFLLLAVAGCAFWPFGGGARSKPRRSMRAVPPLVNLLPEAEALLPSLEQFTAAVQANLYVTLDPASATHLVAAAERIGAGLRRRIEDLQRPASAGAQGTDTAAAADRDREQAIRRLDAAVERSRQLMALQARPFFVTAPALLSGLPTLAAELEQEAAGHPATEPWLDYFQFEGALPGVVPAEGGRVTLVGGNLNGEAPPVVDLLDEQGLRIHYLKALPDTGPDEIQVLIDGETLRQHTGECLTLRIRLPRPAAADARQPATPLVLTLPAYVAPSYMVQLEVVAGVRYLRRRSEQTELPDKQAKRFHWENPECMPAGAKPVSDTQRWPLPNEPGRQECRIVDFKVITQTQRGAGSDIRLTISGPDSITASGMLAGAPCDEAARTPAAGRNAAAGKRAPAAQWSQSVRPVIECQRTDERHSRAVAPAAAFPSPSGAICVEIPLRGTAEAADFWFLVTPIVNGTRARVIHASPGVPADELLFAGEITPVDGLGLEGRLCAAAGDKASVCVTAAAAP